RRVGSTMEAGRLTAGKILTEWSDLDQEDEDDEDPPSAFGALTPSERGALERFLKALEADRQRDPKYAIVREVLLSDRWLEQGCIIFSQYFDSVSWLAAELSRAMPNEEIGIYAGAAKSGVIKGGVFKRTAREHLKARVRNGDLRLILGTDAASEGLNLQRLGTLINLDLPWNPSRLEQRKGRIQRIGQVRDSVDIYNMRYAGSVEDRVHQMLSSRLQEISNLFGQLPDVLEDVWIDVALGQMERAKLIIDAVPRQHPFQLRYHKIAKVDWESCAKVLDSLERKAYLSRGWR
ncbi:MAG: helicase-related protein, partial [Gammaproteobacteria bacterium]